MVVPEVINDSDMVLLARDISKQIEDQMEYPGQIKVSIVRESRVVDYAKQNNLFRQARIKETYERLKNLRF